MPHKIGNSTGRRRHFIREWREHRGMTQEELADLIGTTKTSVSRIENLKQSYTQEVLEACADALGVHQGDLLMRRPPSEVRARKRA
jgi:transcriptional regulator with XRE-family HTH domain